MTVRYDLHIHSALSPCADDEMTPVTIAGLAALGGLDMIAVSDHNAIDNVRVAMRAGEYYGVTVVPAFELQTNEDVHILCLFETFEALKAYFDTLNFQQIKNNPAVFGNQLIMDEDDNVTGTVERLLLASSTVSSQQAYADVLAAGGIAVPAHIDREANGMVQILGAVPPEFCAVELSTRSGAEERARYAETRRVIVDSDAHTADAIGYDSTVELPECSARALIAWLRGAT